MAATLFSNWAWRLNTQHNLPWLTSLLRTKWPLKNAIDVVSSSTTAPLFTTSKGPMDQLVNNRLRETQAHSQSSFQPLWVRFLMAMPEKNSSELLLRHNVAVGNFHSFPYTMSWADWLFYLSEDLLPTQHLGSSLMPPPPSTSRSLSVTYSRPLTGYTSSHANYTHHRNKMMASTNSPQRQVTIRGALHHLKVEASMVGLVEKLVLHDFFFRISGKDPTPRFAPNLKVSFILVMTNAQFEDILSWKLECKRGPGAHGQQVSDEADTDLEEAEQSGVYNPMDEVFRAATTFGQKRCVAQAHGGPSACGESSSNSLSSKRRSASPRTCSALAPLFSSVSPVKTGSPSPRKVAGSPVTIRSLYTMTDEPVLEQDCIDPISFDIPDSSTLKRVMKAQEDVRKQAKSILNNDARAAIIFTVPCVSFAQLLERLRSFDFKDKANQPVVTLAVDRTTKSMVAPAGSFKTCHPASFINLGKLSQTQVTAAPILGLDGIVAKRIYWRASGPTSSRKRLAINDKLAKTLDEANCLSPNAPPITIPRLRLVQAAVAIPQDPCEANAAVYLLEEKITGKFVKYINNNSAVPRKNLEGSGLNIAEFLCFAQHAQYNMTEGLVFLSDFQGRSFSPLSYTKVDW
ncbi:hypothetical protein SERLA73DRAFT_149701 [Serpula lacrymans var. lacrymans S7.3]|uniref:Alpha-type protein kinase domain-containing protein n=1 Tax=Serpula lacrymans var. lacrymans (strain S7.3) TaxID=936435 RepID=F8PIK0_SERL3|nr:hypothetical protein SERLA73DRAFT_149701 [Serpula lacrymans var. lacrymans S7.3]